MWWCSLSFPSLLVSEPERREGGWRERGCSVHYIQVTQFPSGCFLIIIFLNLLYSHVKGLSKCYKDSEWFSRLLNWIIRFSFSLHLCVFRIVTSLPWPNLRVVKTFSMFVSFLMSWEIPSVSSDFVKVVKFQQSRYFIRDEILHPSLDFSSVLNLYLNLDFHRRNGFSSVTGICIGYVWCYQKANFDGNVNFLSLEFSSIFWLLLVREFLQSQVVLF